MKTIGNKNPIIFEIIILVIGLLLPSIVAGVINTISDNSDVSASIARILVGLAFLAIMVVIMIFEAMYGFLIIRKCNSQRKNIEEYGLRANM